MPNPFLSFLEIICVMMCDGLPNVTMIKANDAWDFCEQSNILKKSSG